MTTNPFETGLNQTPANYVPLSPVSFRSRAASAFADKVAAILRAIPITLLDPPHQA